MSDKVFEFVENYVEILDKPQVQKMEIVEKVQELKINSVNNLEREKGSGLDSPKKNLDDDLLFNDGHHEMVVKEEKAEEKVEKVEINVKNIESIKI